MKKCAWVACLLFCNIQLNAVILRWDGEGNDGLWSNALNWDLDRVPDSSDEVILDNSLLYLSYSVTLPPGNSSVSLISLRISPAASLSISFILPVTNTAIPGLVLTGTGDALVLDRGALLRNASGAASGTPLTVTANGFFRINNGGHYIHQTAKGHTDFLVSRLSSSPGTEEGIFEFDVPGTASYTVSVSGRNFGRLIFSSLTAGAGRTYAGAGVNPVTVRGGMFIKENTVFSYGANTDTITIHGICSIATGATFNIANGSNKAIIKLKGNLDNRGLITETGSSTGSGILMNGTSAQLISGAGSVMQEVKLVVDNAAGVILQSPLHLPFQLEFINGKIRSSISNLLSLGGNATCNGAGDSGFVEGPVKKAGRNAFLFPVGVGGIFAPVYFEEGGEAADEFIVNYRRTNPQSSPGLGSNCISPINHVSYVEFWELAQAAGNSSRRIRFSVSPLSFVRNLEAIVVSRFVNGAWISEGGVDHSTGAPSPPYATGTVSTAINVSGFGSFTLGSIVDQQVNPLPIFIERFGSKMINGQVFLSWTSGDCNTPGWRYVLQHGSSGNTLTDLANIPVNISSCDYSFVHYYPLSGQNYYRLNVLNEAGDTLYQTSHSVHSVSRAADANFVRVVRQLQEGIELLSDLPQGNLQVCVISNSGAMVAFQTIQRHRPGEVFSVKIPFLAKGLYRILIISGQTKVSTAFIR